MVLKLKIRSFLTKAKLGYAGCSSIFPESKRVAIGKEMSAKGGKATPKNNQSTRLVSS